MRLTMMLFAFLAAQTAGARMQTPEATSLSGKPLIAVPPTTGEQKARDVALRADLAKAQADYDRDPSNADATIWLGRRLAYLNRFRDAVDVYSRGIQRHPNEARLYRHRGHRYITVGGKGWMGSLLAHPACPAIQPVT